MTYTAVIRQRGQLTVPDAIRDVLLWLRTGSVVGIEAEEETIRITPYTKAKKSIDWHGFLEKVQLARSFRGKRGNLSSVVAADRGSH